MASRREVLRVLALALASTPFTSVRAGHPDIRRLFFDEADIPRIRANASSDFLKPTFDTWRSLEAAEAETMITEVLESGDLLYGWGAGLEQIYRTLSKCGQGRGPYAVTQRLA